MYVLIDNYDSFTYNIYQYMKELTDREIKVVRNDTVRVQDIAKMNPQGIVISPGPGRPEDAGISVETVKHFAGKVPILGICLGHQAIGCAFGGNITPARRIVHGKTEEIRHDGKGLFRTIPSPAVFTRYHSLAVEEDTLPGELEVTSRSRDNEIMGVRHREYDIEGVQFHPESIAAEFGRKLLANFLGYKREPFNIGKTLESIIDGNDLSMEEAEEFMDEVTDGNLSSAQIAGFLTALNTKGLTAGEIAGCAAVLNQKKTPFTGISRPILDTCGTGGDGLETFNISSMAALLAASCGAKVAKHGNRAVSSRSGSADFYRALGLPVEISPEKAADLMEKTGFAFLYAPLYHSAMKHAAVPRRELGIKTIFNLLGPLANPAGADFQMIGVFDEKYCIPIAEAAHRLGVKRAMVVHGFDGLDELSPTGPTKIVTIDESGSIQEQMFDPASLGLPLYSLEDIRGGTAAENGEAARAILEGKGSPAIRDTVLLNTGAALKIYGIAESISDGYLSAREALETGRAAEKLEQIIAVSAEA